MLDISVLKGKIVRKILVHKLGTEDDQIVFEIDDNESYRLYHSQSCCESVTIDDIIGEIENLVGYPLLVSECRSSITEKKEEDIREDTFTWTFYEFATIKGCVTVRWFGTSNGYYSEEVDFERVRES